MVCLWYSPRRWCLGAANHETDRLEILRVSFLEMRKTGIFDKTLSLVITLFYVTLSAHFRTCSITMAQGAIHAKDALAFAFQYSEHGTIHVDKTRHAFFSSITEWSTTLLK